MQKKIILLIENDLPLLQTLSVIFEMEGYQVKGCASGASAADWLAQRRELSQPLPELVLIDVPSSTHPNLAWIEGLRVFGFQIPLLVLADREDALILAALNDLGVKEVADKPLVLKELSWRVNAMVARTRGIERVQD